MDDMDDDTILSLSERELIAEVYHLLRQPSASMRGFLHLLLDGRLGFSNEQQQEIILDLQESLNEVVEADRWFRVWVSSRRQESDEP